MSDFVTALATYGPTLTKTFLANGGTDAYDDAASFKSKEVKVSGIQGLSRLLTELETRHQNCVIRGKLTAGTPEPGKVEGSIARNNANFDDCEHHWFMVDIDKYRPEFGDPVLEAEDVIHEYLEKLMPKSFKGCSFHWQLSSSAGSSLNKHLLKAHVWFWSETAYTSAQMYEWAKSIGPWVDKAVYRRAQVHYTANPIFEAGITDPVPVRSGFYQGTRDTVPLKLAANIIEQARATGSGSGGNDMKLVDPSEKEGLVGLYHRTYDAHTVLLEHLEGMFAEGQNERRWTWLGGGGTPEGVWVHDDGLHVGATHNTWPIDGIVNLWDLVRLLKFGHLDKVEDDFEQLNMDTSPIQGKPSHQAMVAWVESLDAIKGADKREQLERIDGLKKLIADAPDAHDLEHIVAKAISQEPFISSTAREALAVCLQGRMATLLGVRHFAIKEARRLVALSTPRESRLKPPEWAAEWVWDMETDSFVHKATKVFISERSYNAQFDRLMASFADGDGRVPKASDFSLTMWGTEVVDRTLYNPPRDNVFPLDGFKCLNLYRPDLAPQMPEEIGPRAKMAIKIIEEHAAILIPDVRERTLFLDYLAYCIKHPGCKIRWAPLLKGVEGDGKSAFVILMAHCLGNPNVRILDSATLEKSDFSGWGTGQCFTGVEEVKLHGHNRYDVYNKLKPYISNDFIEVHKKGRDPYNAPNTTCYLLLSNFDDAVPVTDNDRRVMFIRSPFNTKEEMFKAVHARTGLSIGDYFDRLFDQAIKPFAGAIRKWLNDRTLSTEFKADGRAPLTSAREMAVDLSVRDDESAVLAAVAEGSLGVYPNLVSTWHLTTMIKNLYEIDLRSSRVSSVLAAAGYRPLGQVKWRGRPCRFYFKGEKPTAPIQPILDALEAEREAQLVEDDFKD